MNRIIYILVLAGILLFPFSAHSQGGPDPRKLLDKLGRNAEAYFLSANRPTYTVNTYEVGKRTFEISIDPSFNNTTVQVPLTVTYGLSNKVELFTGIDIFNQTYKFDGAKVSGIGDANFGVAYEFQSSKRFTHIFQTLVKIPTASANQQMGTGKADYHFGIAEAFTYKKFGYELTFDLGMLNKRPLPNVKNPNKIYTQGLIDSINSFYDYKFEPEIALTFTPIVNFSDSFLLYVGAGFTRNTRFNFNTTMTYIGFGYSPSDAVSITLGGSNGFGNTGNWEATTGAAFSFK